MQAMAAAQQANREGGWIGWGVGVGVLEGGLIFIFSVVYPDVR